MFGFVFFNILESVNDAPADFDEFRSLALPSPTVQRPVGNIPAFGQLFGIEMFFALVPGIINP
jgi:hypothetical protein